MELLHHTWFWVVIIVGPIATVVGILARLAKREPPPDLPPGVKPLGFDDDDEDDWGVPPGRSRPPGRGDERHG
jgi:hypothetical protein